MIDVHVEVGKNIKIVVGNNFKSNILRKSIQGGKQFRKNNSICEIVSNSE